MTPLNQHNIDRLLTNMKIISRIQQYQRLSTKNCLVKIESNHLLLPVKRWWYSEDRFKNIDIVECIINEAFNYTTIFINKYKLNDKRQRSLLFLQQVLKEYTGVCVGLQNLRGTYENDSVTVARLDVLFEKIQQYMNDIVFFLKVPQQLRLTG